VVLLDEGIKHNGEVLVGVPVAGIDTTVLIVKFNRDRDGLVESESRCLGLDVF